MRSPGRWLNIGQLTGQQERMADLIKISDCSDLQLGSVVFVHGLGGDARGTWQHSKAADAFWPQWLADDVPGLGAYSMQYAASASRWRGTAMHLQDRSVNVFERLILEPGLKEGPVAFVCHSLGGLVVKQVLRHASDKTPTRDEARQFLDRVTKVIFFATPHVGSSLATLTDRLRIFFRPSAATSSMVRNDANLRALNGWYRDWSHGLGIDHLVFFETQSYLWPIVKALLPFLVVDPASGDPGLLDVPVIGLDGDHFTICKPVKRGALAYLKVLDFLKRERPGRTSQNKAQLVRIEGRQINDSANLKELLAIARSGGIFARAEQQGFTEQAVRAIVERAGGIGVAGDDLLSWLDVWIEEAQREFSKRTDEGEDFEGVRREAQKRFKAGRLSDASSAFMEALASEEREEAGRQEERKHRRLRLLEEAIAYDELAFDGDAAAQKLRRVAAINGLKTSDEIGEFLFEKAGEFWERGKAKGINAALLVAISAYRAALEELTRERVPLQWATTQNNLGNALWTLGGREGGTARLEEAVQAFRAALEEWTRERVPLDWATTQNNLGNALSTLGGRESGTARLEEAVQAYRAALEVFTVEVSPATRRIVIAGLDAALAMIGRRN